MYVGGVVVPLCYYGRVIHRWVIMYMGTRQEPLTPIYKYINWVDLRPPPLEVFSKAVRGYLVGWKMLFPSLIHNVFCSSSMQPRAPLPQGFLQM